MLQQLREDSVDHSQSIAPSSTVGDGFAHDNVSQQLEGLRARANNTGGGGAVMRAMYLCAVHGVALPDWLAQHFARRASLVLAAELGSWDDAFGRPWRSKSEEGLKRSRERIELRTRVYARVWRLVIYEHRRVNEELFAQLAAEFGRSSSTVERLYYEAVEGGSPSVAGVRRAMGDAAASSHLPAEL